MRLHFFHTSVEGASARTATGSRRVIFNADDFGLTDGVCRGISEAIDAGIVTATTAMVCCPGAEERLAHWGPRLAGRIGIHMQLTDGKPCLDTAAVPSLVNGEGVFPRSPGEVTGVDPSEVKQEWSAQIERLNRWGITPTHMDSHHHVGIKPHTIGAYSEVARAHRIPARTASFEITKLLRSNGIRCADLCMTAWYDADLSVRGLLRLIEAAFAQLKGQGTVEIMCHPGYADDALAARSKYVRQRERELQVLTSTKLTKGLQRLDVGVAPISSIAA
jgi:predicted glycoside hydrolase/deacetylase ChbG (UPF0249 family)